MRVPLTVIVLLLAALLPAALADEGGSGSGEVAARASEPAPLATIAARVERLRDLSFRRQPVAKRVSAKTAREEGLADLDRGYPEARRRADEALYTLLGLLPAGTDLREVQGSIFGEQVAGYYDPRTDRLRIVEGAGTSNRVLDEMVMAHELVHALEDQRFELDVERAEATGDGALAYLALVEGTATAVMEEYVVRHIPGDEALGGLLGGAFAGTGSTELPPFVTAGLVFPYTGGSAFVGELHRRAGGRWALIDLALRSRPPLSTEQVLHPEAWLRVDAPERVDAGRVGERLGDGWDRVTAGTFGEWQTGELVALGGRHRPEAVDHWAGDRYELWRRDAAEPCDAPCPERDVLVMRWRWDTAAEAAEFEAALSGALRESAGARSGATVRLRTHGRETTLIVAPDAATATRLAR